MAFKLDFFFSKQKFYLTSTIEKFLLTYSIKPTHLQDITGLDGTNQWPQISTAQNTTRTSFIYNINPYGEGATPYIV